jgi:hypothetical protein
MLCEWWLDVVGVGCERCSRTGMGGGVDTGVRGLQNRRSKGKLLTFVGSTQGCGLRFEV